MVIQFAGGGDLFNLLEKRRRLPEDAVRIYVAEVVLAIEALHTQHICYRDLKPENILIGLDGKRCSFRASSSSSSFFSSCLICFFVSSVVMAISFSLLPSSPLGHILLADFGLGKPLPSSNWLSGSLCGTPEYLAPEMIQGHRYDAQDHVEQFRKGQAGRMISASDMKSLRVSIFINVCLLICRIIYRQGLSDSATSSLRFFDQWFLHPS